MASMLIIVVGLMAAVNPEFLTGSYDYRTGYEFDEATCTVYRYNGPDNNIIIPSTIKWKKVKKIGENAFACNNKTYKYNNSKWCRKY
jgi:hypothetical protein